MNNVEVVKEVIINNQLGLHARPAAMVAKEASKYESDIKLVMDDIEVDAKSILDILTLAASQGKSIKIVARGKDAKEAVEELEKIFLNGFGEK